MKPGIRLLCLLFFVLLALGNSQLSAQSGKTVTKQSESENAKQPETGTTRKLISCPVPENIYSDSGTVFVIVRISKRGRITKTQIDRAKSTTENKALYNNALKAAAYARYNRIEKDTVETGQLKFKFKLK